MRTAADRGSRIRLSAPRIVAAGLVLAGLFAGLSAATAAPRPRVVPDVAASSVAASPATLAADGRTASTVTVKVARTGGGRVVNSPVKVHCTNLLNHTVPSHARISPRQARTGSDGIARFTITDTLAQTLGCEALVTTPSGNGSIHTYLLGQFALNFQGGA